MAARRALESESLKAWVVYWTCCLNLVGKCFWEPSLSHVHIHPLIALPNYMSMAW